MLGPDVERLADLAVDVAVGEPSRGGVLADLVRQVLHPPPAACNDGTIDLVIYISNHLNIIV